MRGAPPAADVALARCAAHATGLHQSPAGAHAAPARPAHRCCARRRALYKSPLMIGHDLRDFSESSLKILLAKVGSLLSADGRGGSGTDRAGRQRSELLADAGGRRGG